MAQNTNTDMQIEAMITQASTMGTVRQIIDRHLAETSAALVAFDVDMTLTVPRHPACHHPNMKMHQAALEHLLKPLSEVEEDKTLTLATQAPGQQLAEKDTPVVVKTLQNQGITTIAFTASLTGALEGLGHLQERRFQDLQALSMNFQSAFTFQELLLDELPANNHNHPAYHQGILYANGGRRASNKGAVLVAFLQRAGWKPQRIVMVDDLLKNLTYIAQALTIWDPTIEFVGIEYHGAQTYASQNITEEHFVAYWQGIIDQVNAQPHQRKLLSTVV